MLAVAPLADTLLTAGGGVATAHPREPLTPGEYGFVVLPQKKAFGVD